MSLSVRSLRGSLCKSLCAAWLAAGALGVLSACELAVEVDVPEHAPQLVAHEFFAPDSAWTVRLRRSTDIAGSEDIRKLTVTDAAVRVTDEAGGSSASLAHIGEGIYAAPLGVHPVPGVAYTLEAEAPGLPSIRAVSSIPAARASIERLERLDDPDNRFSFENYRVSIRIEDPPGTNYYKLELYRWSPVGEENVWGFRSIVDKPGSSLAFLEIPFESNETSFRYKDYAYFFDSPEITGDDTSFYGALFSDELFDGQTKSFEITVSERPFEMVESRYRLVLSVLSNDYFVYHHTALLQAETVGEINIAAALLQTPPVHLHSNIEEGLGVFAGYAVHTFGFDAEGNVWSGEEER